MKNDMKNVILACVALAVLFAQSLGAQEPQEQIEEIVVTAQKREQSIQEVPFSITAIGADLIENRDITDIVQIGGMVPNLQVTHTPGGSVTCVGPWEIMTPLSNISSEKESSTPSVSDSAKPASARARRHTSGPTRA